MFSKAEVQTEQRKTFKHVNIWKVCFLDKNDNFSSQFSSRWTDSFATPLWSDAPSESSHPRVAAPLRAWCWSRCERRRLPTCSRCRRRPTGTRCRRRPPPCSAPGWWVAAWVAAGTSWTRSAGAPSRSAIVARGRHYHGQRVRVNAVAVGAQHTCNRSKLVSNLSTFSSRSSPADTFNSSRRPSFRRMSFPLCSSWALAWGNSWRASIRSCLERQKRSEYPRLRILAVRLLPILLPLMLRMLISPKQLPEVRTANCVTPSSPTTASCPSFMMYISLPTSPLEKEIVVICDAVSSWTQLAQTRQVRQMHTFDSILTDWQKLELKTNPAKRNLTSHCLKM